MSRRQTNYVTPSALILAINADAPNRRSIAQVVRSAGGQAVAAANAFDAVQVLGSRQPAMIICSIPAKSVSEGLDAITMFHARVPGCPIVAFADSPDYRMAVGCMRAGASDVFAVDDMKGSLFVAIQEVVRRAGNGPGTSEVPRTADLFSSLDDLGRRILDLVRQRLSNKAAAAACHCSEKTVERRVKVAYEALGVNSRYELLRALDALDTPLATAVQAG